MQREYRAMGQSASSQQHGRYPAQEPSPYASAVIRKKPHLQLESCNPNSGMIRSIPHDTREGLQSLSSASTPKSSSNSSTVSSSSDSSGGTLRYIPKMKEGGQGLLMPRGGNHLQHSGIGEGSGPTDPNPGYASPDSWGFHINITPTQEMYTANSGMVPTAGPHSGMYDKDGKQRRLNPVFQNLQNSNKTNMGWTSVPI